MTTVHPQVHIRWKELQQALYSIEMSIWGAQQELGKLSVSAVYLTPSPAFTEASAALLMAHSYVGKIREALRDAEKGQQS
jgi:hypothetical protein